MTPLITIKGRQISPRHHVYIIAEAGINHNGSVEIAFEMVKQAKLAGADAIKFQIITSERSYAKHSESFAIFKKIEFNKDQWRKIIALCAKENIDTFATFVNAEDIKDYEEFDFPVFKVSSSNVTNFPLLEVIAAQRKPVLLSSGLSFMSEVKEAVECLKAHGQREISLLQCTSIYPTPPSAVNLNVITTLSKEFPTLPIGFSDHSNGFCCAIASVALGSCIIEKHFTLDKNMLGLDHAFSADPQELTDLVNGVRMVERALGSFIKEPVLSELTDRVKLQRSIVAKKSINAGEVLTADHIVLKRSNFGGLSPKLYRSVIGKTINRALRVDDPITTDMLGD